MRERLQAAGVVMLGLSRADFIHSEDRELLDQIKTPLTKLGAGSSRDPLQRSVEGMSDALLEEVASGILELRDAAMGRAIRNARITTRPESHRGSRRSRSFSSNHGGRLRPVEDARVIWQDGDVATTITTTRGEARSVAELTRVVFGEELSIDQVLIRLERRRTPSVRDPNATTGFGSAPSAMSSTERSPRFASHVHAAGVERLIDVRELPISRRRGYAKTALGQAMADVGIEYMHVRALGNPKPLRDLYKSGRVREGRRRLRGVPARRAARTPERPVRSCARSATALMCVEHDPARCHRTVILEALRSELGLALDVAEIG